MSKTWYICLSQAEDVIDRRELIKHFIATSKDFLELASFIESEN